MGNTNKTIADVDKLDMADSQINSNETQVLKDRLVESERRAQLLETRLARLESDRQDTGVRDRGLFHPVIDVINAQNNNHEHQFEHDNMHYPPHPLKKCIQSRKRCHGISSETGRHATMTKDGHI